MQSFNIAQTGRILLLAGVFLPLTSPAQTQSAERAAVTFYTAGNPPPYRQPPPAAGVYTARTAPPGSVSGRRRVRRASPSA